MSWISHHWQTLAALTIVGVTLMVFVLRFLRHRKAPGCGHNCGCGVKK